MKKYSPLSISLVFVSTLLPITAQVSDYDMGYNAGSYDQAAWNANSISNDWSHFEDSPDNGDLTSFARSATQVVTAIGNHANANRKFSMITKKTWNFHNQSVRFRVGLYKNMKNNTGFDSYDDHVLFSLTPHRADGNLFGASVTGDALNIALDFTNTVSRTSHSGRMQLKNASGVDVGGTNFTGWNGAVGIGTGDLSVFDITYTYNPALNVFDVVSAPVDIYDVSTSAAFWDSNNPERTGEINGWTSQVANPFSNSELSALSFGIGTELEEVYQGDVDRGSSNAIMHFNASATSVPEPAVSLLSVIGLGVGLLRRKR